MWRLSGILGAELLGKEGLPRAAVAVGFSQEGEKCPQLGLDQELVSIRRGTEASVSTPEGGRALGSALSHPPECPGSQFAPPCRPKGAGPEHTRFRSAAARELVLWECPCTWDTEKLLEADGAESVSRGHGASLADGCTALRLQGLLGPGLRQGFKEPAWDRLPLGTWTEEVTLGGASACSGCVPRGPGTEPHSFTSRGLSLRVPGTPAPGEHGAGPGAAIPGWGPSSPPAAVSPRPPPAAGGLLCRAQVTGRGGCGIQGQYLTTRGLRFLPPREGHQQGSHHPHPGTWTRSRFRAGMEAGCRRMSFEVPSAWTPCSEKDTV